MKYLLRSFSFPIQVNISDEDWARCFRRIGDPNVRAHTQEAQEKTPPRQEMNHGKKEKAKRSQGSTDS